MIWVGQDSRATAETELEITSTRAVCDIAHMACNVLGSMIG